MENKNQIYSLNDYKKEDFPKSQENKVPIYNGCPNTGQCFCTGVCREIVGYRDKHPLEK